MSIRLTIFLLLLIGVFREVEAAVFTSVQNGPWTTAATWGGASTPTFNDVVTIQHAVTLGAGSYSGSGSVTIQSGGSLSVTGNLTITGSGTKLIVGSTGSLVVSGTFSINNQSRLTMSGGTTTVHTMTVDGGTYEGNSGIVNVTTGGLSTTSSGNTQFTNNAGTTINLNTGSSTGSLTSNRSLTNSGTIIVNNNANVTQGNSGGTFSNSGSITVGGTFTANSTVNNSGTLTTAILATPNSGGTFTNTGFVTATTANIAGTVNLNPGASGDSRLTVTGTLNLTGSGMTVGNGVPGSPAKYADLVIQGNLSQTSHSITVNCNGRVAVFGDLTLSGGGGLQFNINNCGTDGSGVPIGGQVYVDGDGSGNSVTNTSSGGAVNNNNPNFTSNGTPNTPYGFYVNGPTTGGVDADRGNITVMQNSNPSFFTWVSTLPNSPLPITLFSFKVTSVDKEGITLQWVTTMEKNFDRFELERASSDLEFTSIASIQGKGGLDIKSTYQFIDDDPAQGKNYYRLKSIDIDGAYEYSSVIVGSWDGVSNGISIYPNPVTNSSFTLDLNDELTAPATVSLVEARGFVVSTSSVTISSSSITLPENLAPGIYFVKISASNGQKTIRVVVDK